MFGLNPWVLIGFGIALMLAAAGGAGTMAKIKNGEIAKIELSIEKARAEAKAEGSRLQHETDQAAIAAATGQVIVQEKIVTRTVQIQKEIPIYVQDSSNCITWGLVRVLDAGANGVDPATLNLPAGQLNESCAPFGSQLLADRIVGNYGLSRQNAEQLTGLQAYALRLKAALESGQPVAH